MLADAIRTSKETGLRLRHPGFGAGEWMTSTQLAEAQISVGTAVSEAWELEPRILNIKEERFRETLIPILRKYAIAGKIDHILQEAQEAFFPAHHEH